MTKPSTLLIASSVVLVIVLALGGLLVQTRAASLAHASPGANATLSAASARKEDLLAHQTQLRAAVDRLNSTLQSQLALEQTLSNQLASLTGQQPSQPVQQAQPAPQPAAQPVQVAVPTTPIRTTRAS